MEAVMHDQDEYGYPVKPGCPGTNTFQRMNEALDRIDQAKRQRQQNPTRAYPVDYTVSMDDWIAAEDGLSLWRRDRAYFTPQDGFDFKEEKK
jgi:hypothetical protein